MSYGILEEMEKAAFYSGYLAASKGQPIEKVVEEMRKDLEAFRAGAFRVIPTSKPRPIKSKLLLGKKVS